MSAEPWADPNHNGNTIRPRVRCIGCGTLGCITAWGPWCFKCNVPRMKRLNAAFENIADNLAKLNRGAS
jgi:hypothetical protein